MKVAIVALALAGCAPALSSFQPAHVAPKGSATVELGADISVPTSTVGTLIDTAKTLSSAAKDRDLTDAERDQLFAAGVALARAPPAAVPHLGATFSPATDWEIGLRYASGGVRLGMRRQLLHQANDGIDLTVGIGATRFAYEFPVSDILGVIELNDFTRYSIDLPITIGQHRDFARWWAGPRVAFDTYETSLTFTQPAVAGNSSTTTLASLDGKSAFVGGQLGVAVGFRHVFLAAELTIVKLYSTAHASILDDKRDYKLDGIVVYPGLALTGEL